MPITLAPPFAVLTCGNTITVDIVATLPSVGPFNIGPLTLGFATFNTPTRFTYQHLGTQNGADTLVVTDAITGETATMVITVSGCPPAPLQIISSIGQFTYLDCGQSVRLTAINGVGPYIWNVTALLGLGTIVFSGAMGEFMDFTATTPINASPYFAVVSVTDTALTTAQSFVGLRFI